MTPEACGAWVRGRTPQTYSISRQSGVVIDGDLSDWPKDAFSVGPLGAENGSIRPAEDFDVRARLGWDAGGILFGFEIRDDMADESSSDHLQSRDAVSVRIADPADPDRFLIVDIAPGADVRSGGTRAGGTRVKVRDRSTLKADVQAVGRSLVDAFVLEVRIAMDAFGGISSGDVFPLQFTLHDRDGEHDSFHVAWFPWEDVSVGGMSHHVRLSDQAGPSVPGFASGSYPDFLNAHIKIVCDASLVGRSAAFYDGEKEVASGVLEEGDGLAQVLLTTRMPERGQPYGDPYVLVDGGGRIPVSIPDADERRAWRFTWHRVMFDDYAFSGDAFPEPRLEDPLFAEHLIGAYQIEADYYDRNYEKVTAPVDDGRYGAAVSIVSKETGKTYRRFRTLYKYSGHIRWWNRFVDASIELPEEFGIDPAVLDDNGTEIADHLKWQFRAGLYREQRTGALLAGLSESVPGEGAQSVYNDVWARDRSWWVGLKRKVYGQDPVSPLQCPTGVFKGRARELVFGSEEEAGRAAGAVDSIDEICHSWWEDSGEPFSICVARRGKIAHLKSYGSRVGAPVTLTTKTPVASITKLLTGTLMAMLIEHRRVDLDAPLATYLPGFKDTPVGQTLTVRHLMNHTNGLEGHWGDEENDFDEQVVGYADEMAIETTYQYNGTAFAVAGKVIEAVSGESLPKFAKTHLFDPLDMRDTDMVGTSQDAMTTPLDLARVGQLLLNGGAYGDFRFFEHEAFQELLPHPLKSVIAGTYRQYGMGTEFYRDEGFGEGTFGHGSATSSIFRVDPVNDLVIVVTRWQQGEGYAEHKKRLFDTIVSHLFTKNES